MQPQRYINQEVTGSVALFFLFCFVFTIVLSQ